ncbi:hypothetical protein PMG11_01910 [Penicillium brasilianum]|uniref:Protein kinase domain-containing protein n=1 Tax=Penicillium brasilianum TaxID=104259 RepID=A0A0F7TIE6_PENBI|nr:hypothetical protein PMG11_01910 [Penicillium brasilianum]
MEHNFSPSALYQGLSNPHFHKSYALQSPPMDVSFDPWSLDIMTQRVTQIFIDIPETEESDPSASTPVPRQTESQPLVTPKLTKEVKQLSKQDPSKNVLRDHGRDNRQGEGLAVHSPVIQRGCPWDTLKDLFTCDLAGPVTLAIHKQDPRKLIAVRSFSRDKADKWLDVLRRTKHPNVVCARQIFKDHGTTYSIFDDLPLTLEHVVACDIFPSELQLASILIQALDGLTHLLECGFEHESLNCSNILLGQDGAIQIGMFNHHLDTSCSRSWTAALEHCTERQPNQSQAKLLRALTKITTLLMQKYLKADSVVGIDSTRWQSDPLEFLSATASVATIQDLREHSLITKHRCAAGTLVGLARLCLITTRTFILKPWSQENK